LKPLSEDPFFTFRFASKTLEETQNIARIIGENVPEGFVITLSGTLGSGKTTFVQGLAKGLDVPDDYYITSPTYAIMHDYPGRFPLYHIDLYRLTDEEDLYDIGMDEIIGDNGIKAVEWPEKIPGNFFTPDISVTMTVTSEFSRDISLIVYRRAARNLIQALKMF
jgi:tRNA threonylcarbamoyladenosine biosynthesis protein TsaE